MKQEKCLVLELDKASVSDHASAAGLVAAYKGKFVKPNGSTNKPSHKKGVARADPKKELKRCLCIFLLNLFF